MRIFRKPLISVIMASYNHARFIEAAVQSVLDQTLSDLEIIVLDDGSSDNTVDIVSRIKDRRLKLIQFTQNRRYHPRNYGLSLAKGKYIAFQNSDDVWEHDKLKAQVRILENRKEVVASFTGVKLIDAHDRGITKSWAQRLFTTTNRNNDAWLRRFFDSGNCLCITSAVVLKRKLDQAGHFKPSLVQLSDLDLWVRFAGLGQFHIIKHQYTRMRILTGQNASHPTPANSRRALLEYATVLKRYTQKPVVKYLTNIFPDIMPPYSCPHSVRLALLALYAWNLGSPAHYLFADVLMSSLLDDSEARKHIVKVLGTQVIHDFLHHRGQLNLAIIKAR